MASPPGLMPVTAFSPSQVDVNQQTRLTSSALLVHTRQHPPSSNKTIKDYLSRSLPFQGQFEQDVGLTPLSPTKAITPPLFAHYLNSKDTKRHTKQQHDNFDDENQALVLLSDIELDQQGKPILSKFNERHKRTKSNDNNNNNNKTMRTSLVKAMKPRISATLKQQQSSDSIVPSNQKQVTSPAPTPVASTSKFDPTTITVTDSALPKRNQQSQRSSRVVDEHQDFEKGKGKSTSSLQGQQTRANEARRQQITDVEEEEEQREFEALLEARKQRRRRKALIVKDKTITPTETGRRAAQRIKRRRATTVVNTGREKDNVDENVADGSDTGKRTKRKRSKASERSLWELQEQQRPKTVQPGRLTLKPQVQLGMFNKGVASARTSTRTLRGTTNVAFMEDEFINKKSLDRVEALQEQQTRVTKQSDSNSSVDSLTRHRARQQPRSQSKAKKTYGSNSKKTVHITRSSGAPDLSSGSGTGVEQQNRKQDVVIDNDSLVLRRRSQRVSDKTSERRSMTLQRSLTSSASEHSKFSIEVRRKNDRSVSDLSTTKKNVHVDTSQYFKTLTTDVNAAADESSSRNELIVEPEQGFVDATGIPVKGQDDDDRNDNDASCSDDDGSSSMSIERMLLACEDGLVPKSSNFTFDSPQVENLETLALRQGSDNEIHVFETIQNSTTSSLIEHLVEPVSDQDGFVDDGRYTSSPVEQLQDHVESTMIAAGELVPREHSLDAFESYHDWPTLPRIDMERMNDGIVRQQTIDQNDEQAFRQAMRQHWYRTTC
ncbi:hypothetical protein OIO90_002195 [Microbotryomycetes sp. JL221]|nr:hypothetical protein OIO90_002195 [Microbotryomycetes sp. JL221]